MSEGKLTKRSAQLPRIFSLALAALASWVGMSTSQVAFAQTAMGEIQDRPAPVYRCPGLPCVNRNVFNISVAVHYSPSAADLTAIRNMISNMSTVLFDVTDGQAEIGEAFIYLNAPSSTLADLRIYPSTTDTWWMANTGNYKVGGSMHVSINRILAAPFAGESLAHEFVHLVFDGRDEYEARAAGCGAVTGGASCPTAPGETNCLMDGGGGGASSELCWSGNHEPAHVTEHSRCRSNRSCWDQVVWSWPDHFTIPAGGPVAGTGGGVVNPTQFVVASSAVRVVLVLDESGSMSSESPSRMERLKVAASDFVSLAENGTELGLVSFSTDAEGASGHANVPIAALNAAQRTACTTAISGLTPGGWTGIGLGLAKARQMIIDAGGVTANTYIVLMTDGINNRPLPDWAADLNAAQAALLADGIPVFVTCTGGDLGLSSQCSEIATATGGFSVDSANPARLPEAFADFHERISGREALDSAAGVLSENNNLVSKKVFIEKGSDSATFTLLWHDPKARANLTVIDPAGNSHQSVAMPQGRFVRLKAPETGDYTMIVNHQGGSIANTFVARAYARHQINGFAASIRRPTVLPGRPMYVYAYPRSQGGSLTDISTIFGTVILPDGKTDKFELHDRGRGDAVDGDDLGHDGTWTGVYFNTKLKGTYQFLINADMNGFVTAAEGEGAVEYKSPRFNRQVRLSAAVGEPSDVAGLCISINEWMASNTKTLRNPVTQSFDPWFELFNPNPVAVDLSGWMLVNSLSSAAPYVIPQGYTLPAKAFRIVWADGRNLAEGDLHVNFRLNAKGDTIAVLAPDGKVVDHATFGLQSSDVSEGHSPDGGPYSFFFDTATPAKSNQTIKPPQLRATASLSGRLVKVSFETVPGLTYRVEYKNAVNAARWTQLAPAQVASGKSLSVVDTLSDKRQRFYRVVIVQW